MPGIKNPNKIIVDGEAHLMSAAYYKGAKAALGRDAMHGRPHGDMGHGNTPDAWDAGFQHATNNEHDRFGTSLLDISPKGVIFPEDPRVTRDAEGKCHSTQSAEVLNVIVVDGDRYPINAHYKQGAMAARDGAEETSNPFLDRQARDTDRLTWEAGYKHERQGQHHRYGIDVLSIPPANHMFPEAPRVNCHVLTDIVHGGHDDFAALTLWIDRDAGIAHLTGHSGSITPLDGPTPPYDTSDLWEAYGEKGHYAIFSKAEMAVLVTYLEPYVAQALAGEDVGEDIQAILDSADLAQAPYAGSEFDEDTDSPTVGPK